MDEHAQPFRIKHFAISADLFTSGFPEGAGPCSCTSTCCEGGVWVDIQERDRILAHVDLIKEQMDGTQTRDHAVWFDPDEVADADFASGKCVGTAEINNKCVFLDGSGRCSLQVSAVAHGMHKWALKPLYCILYPIEVTDNVIGFDTMLQSEQSCCTVDAVFQTPVFEACREELVHLLGEDGFRQMQQYYEAHYQRSEQGVRK
jgi:Protein of unknown function (DUF3109)